MPKKVTDLAGQVFERLTVLDQAETAKRHTRWRCRCSCGNITIVSAGNLQAGAVKSCGCYRKGAVRRRWRRSNKYRKYGRLISQVFDNVFEELEQK